MLVRLQSDLVGQRSAALVRKWRVSTLQQFERALGEDHKEEFWRQLLRENPWIFGGANIAIVDESRIDLWHIADIPFEVAGGFVDIVELKRPNFPFWTTSRSGGSWRYRGKFFTPHPELSDAVAQMRHYNIASCGSTLPTPTFVNITGSYRFTSRTPSAWAKRDPAKRRVESKATV